MATRNDRASGLLVAAVVANGLLVGASLDQSIKASWLPRPVTPDRDTDQEQPR